MAKVLRERVRADWEEMERVNEMTYEFMRSLGLEESDVDTFTMVVCELTENAIKYGNRAGAHDETLDLTAAYENGELTVRLVNYIDSQSADNLQHLDRAVQWARSFQDPFQAYIGRVKEISRELADSSRSGLGIVRIAYEARATIDFIVGEDDTLTVSAVARTGAANGTA